MNPFPARKETPRLATKGPSVDDSLRKAQKNALPWRKRAFLTLRHPKGKDLKRREVLRSMTPSGRRAS